MAVSSDFVAYIVEQLTPLTRVTSRRMFGGVGLYADGIFFGLIDDDTLYFKVDDSNRPDYQRRGSNPLRPFADKPDLSMSYFDVPADVLDDGEELSRWARKSVAAALSMGSKRRSVKKKSAAKKKK